MRKNFIFLGYLGALNGKTDPKFKIYAKKLCGKWLVKIFIWEKDINQSILGLWRESKDIEVIYWNIIPLFVDCILFIFFNYKFGCSLFMVVYWVLYYIVPKTFSTLLGLFFIDLIAISIMMLMDLYHDFNNHAYKWYECSQIIVLKFEDCHLFIYW